ncbi:MAG: sulfite exporter TauE/SafE family protein [Capnocytophaga sp.]|nr:sulfite exporter TauE/SafE family protein [Capnocytophaga sp.]
MDIILVFVVSFIAFSISAICGGGAGLMLIPVLGRVLPITQVPAALSVGTATSSVSRIAIFWKNIKWSITVFFLPAALPAAWLGTWMLTYINPIWVELLMALFLIANLPLVFKKNTKISNDEIKKLPSWTLFLIGAMAGFISGVTGAVGLLFNRFYLRYGLTNNEVVATRAANEVLLHIVKLILYIQFGLFTIKVLQIGIAVALAALLSSFFMKIILPKISAKWFQKVGYLAMVISGFIMLFGFVNKAQTENNAKFYTNLTKQGFNSHLTWAEDNYTIEFGWDEGFEFEKVIEYKDLPIEKQKQVDLHTIPHHYRIFEVVYSVGDTSYEVYYLDKNKKLIEKINF